MKSKRILIVGGVAGGATAATSSRRLSEEAEIILFEKGPHVSFANCGLPYFVGGEIVEKSKLLVQTPASLNSRFNLDVRVSTEVIAIDKNKKEIEARDLTSGNIFKEPYDELIISIGAKPLKPPISGIERPGHFTVRNIPDVEQIMDWIQTHSARRAVVVGGGYIGLEMAEQLHVRGLEVALAEALPQVMAPLDFEMAAWLHEELESNGIALHLGNAVDSFDSPAEGEQAIASVVQLKNGVRLPADLVILGLGVRPEVKLLQDAGVELGQRGGIRVNEFLQTSDPNIWAVGDAIEVKDAVTGMGSLIPLAGPANRQGRIVAENIFGQRVRYRGTWGTSALRLFSLTAGCTGANAKTLGKAGIPFEAVHLHPRSHAEYYPGSHRLALKIIFSPDTGKLLGAQAVGRDGVDKRIDVLATALQAGMTVHDLTDLELAYAPPLNSAKDPVNLGGMIAEHVVKGEIQVAQWDEMEQLDEKKTVLLDVRDDDERNKGFIPGSIHIPLSQIRDRLHELPKDREIITYCLSGQRSYFACCILKQHGYQTRNLTGAYRTWEIARRK